MARMEKIKRTRNSEFDRKSRVEALRNQTGLKLNTYATSSIDSRSVSGNIENFIGTVSIPVGFAGPLNINYKESSQEVYAPLATTEGALISSVQRGSVALNLSGGVTARTISSKMIRAPQYEFESIDNAIHFANWIKDRFLELKQLVKNKSNFAQLIEIDPKIFGRTIHLRFVYSTGNAAGQNMTTFCTAYLCNWINEKYQSESNNCIVNYIIEGNLSSDKKASQLSAIEGRGRSVIVEATIKGNVLKKILKISAENLFQNFTRSKSARIFSGMIGFNINVSNVVAALFMATGQDMACVHESSVAELHMELHGDDIYVSLYLPCLIVGTIGGGTQLPNFRENIEMLGCYRVTESANRLAETIGAFALALEISTVSAVGAGQFVEAHEVFGRNLSNAGLTIKEIDTDFFKKSLDDKTVCNVNQIQGQNKQGFVTDIAQQVSKKLSGIFAYEIQTTLKSKKAFLKIKAHDREIILGSAKVLEVLNPGMAELLIKRSEHLPFKNCHLREIEILSKKDPIIEQVAPCFLGSFIDFNKEAFVLIQEKIGDDWFISEILNTQKWNLKTKESAIRKLAGLHKKFLNHELAVKELSPSIIEMLSLDKFDEQMDLWDALFTLSYSQLKNNYPVLFQFYSEALVDFEITLNKLAQLDKTLIHYDFNPRNIAYNDKQEIKIFDWEFAAWGVPQRDLIEFILFVSTAEDVVDDFEILSKLHYEILFSDYRADQNQSYRQWIMGCQLSLKEFTLKRLPFYFVLAELSFCPYIDRVLKNTEVLITHWKNHND